MLYLVPTPIGNLKDMTPRAVDVLNEVALILAEDTRNSGRLLKHFSIDTPMRAYHAHNEHKVLDEIVRELESGKNIAVITDGGSPGISDPGFLLSRECRERGIEICSLPGPTAIIPALTNSGLPSDKFLFYGFLPKKKGRKKAIKELSAIPYTLILYESSHRIARTLQELQAHFAKERKASISKEISKLYETVIHGTLEEISQQFPRDKKHKGEYAIVIEAAAN